MSENVSPDVIRFNVVGIIHGQQTINSFYYAGTIGDVPLDDMIAAFVDQVVPPIQSCTSIAWGVLRCDAEFVKGGFTFGSQEINQSGGVSGDCLPNFVSWDFTLLRSAVGERNGYKRFAGIPESYQTDGTATGTALANLAALADAIYNPVTVSPESFVPVIRRTKVHHVSQVPPRYYDVGNVVYSKIGSQNSRKPGHGR